ncbi:uncharacterized protein LOC130455554 [Monodelphis domestica]|uniref:uncharacterized protein LOC130455554 n=1 Tax=Monodelphis domestica TaxID=13616 RepID=UPI0024E1AB31|nr:uncharacterized protein LOC130455554 [Monodelphis domestica]XP_056662037.1 uncharacterized protein LOC130455554 [Monodelphis domestica]XP_056662038.1 uncharacterized protein LOC130455554 [Monodelphis domestica]
MMPRGRAWTQQEISCLLTLIQDSGEVTLLMASTSRPNEALWQSISQGLGASGYGRSVAQCRSKWKALKQAFYSEWETSRQAGGPSSQPPPHYRTMKRLWKAAGRPVFGERRLPGSETNLEAGPPSCAKKETNAPEEKQESPPPSQLPEETPALVPEIPVRPDLVPEVTREEPAHVSVLQGPGVVSLLQNMQELLVQILQTSRQQQALLESLAQDTVSHLHLLSDGLGQMGQTLQALLMHSPSWQSPRSLLTTAHTGTRPHPSVLGLHSPHSPSIPAAPVGPCLKEETILPPPRFAPL